MFEFETGEMLTLEDGRLARVCGFSGDRINFVILDDEEEFEDTTSRTYEELAALRGE